MAARALRLAESLYCVFRSDMTLAPFRRLLLHSLRVLTARIDRSQWDDGDADVARRHRAQGPHARRTCKLAYWKPRSSARSQPACGPWQTRAATCRSPFPDALALQNAN